MDPLKDGHKIKKKRNLELHLQDSKGDVTYEEFLSQQDTNIWNQEHLDLEYKFWETQEDKYLRLKKIWINLKKKNAIASDASYSDQFKNSREFHDLTKNIVEITRKMRWRVD